MDKVIIIQMLNKIFHDEALDVQNLKSLLEICLEEGADKYKKLLISTLIAALNARLEISRSINSLFYEFRNILEKGDHEKEDK